MLTLELDILSSEASRLQFQTVVGAGDPPLQSAIISLDPFDLSHLSVLYTMSICKFDFLHFPYSPNPRTVKFVLKRELLDGLRCIFYLNNANLKGKVCGTSQWPYPLNHCYKRYTSL